MTSHSYAKFTFFEAATQHGWVVALMLPRLQKSLHTYNIIVDNDRGRIFQAFKSANPNVPFFEYVIPDRSTTESTEMWRRRVEKELGAAWKALTEGSGKGTTAESSSEPSKTESSSPSAPPPWETSPSESDQAATESSEPAPSPQSEAPLTNSKASSRTSKGQSRKTA